MMNNYNAFQHQRGFTLIEAIIAFVVIAVGTLAAFRFHTTTMATTGEAKVRSEAVALAEQKLEELRSYFGAEELDPDADGVYGNDFDADMPSLSDADFIAETNTDENLPAVFIADGYAASFTRNWSVRGTNPRQVDVRVTWNDRTNTAQRVQLSSLVWETIPADGAAQFAQVMTDAAQTNVWNNGGGGGGGTDVEVIPLDGSGDSVFDEYGDPILDIDGVPVVTVYYNLEFTGTYTTTNAALTNVSLNMTSGSQTTSNCDDISPTTYTCTIRHIDDGDTWQGGITFSVAAIGPGASSPGVCELTGSTPVDTAVLSFNQNSTSLAASSTPDISSIRVVKKATGGGNNC